MVYHCTLDTSSCVSVCACPLLPLGQSRPDIVDEALAFWRANVLFRSFEVAGAGDKLLLYISLYISHCLQREEPWKSPQDKGLPSGVCQMQSLVRRVSTGALPSKQG